MFLSVSKPKANQAAATALVLSILVCGSFIVVSECKSAIKKKESFLGSLDNSIAGIIAPNKFPKCGLPELCMPVKILAMNLIFVTNK